MRKIIRYLLILAGICLVPGFIVSGIEKKKGWVKGHKPYGVYEKHFKRPLDFGLSLFALVIFWPVLVVVFIAVRLKLGSPVIFTQERSGLGGVAFRIKKFRTMTDAADAEGKPLPDEERLTSFGKFIRSTSCDELASLLNIMSGDMSIIGPRALPVRYMPYYTEEERHRCDVRPGLSGLAQVNGRNYVSWEDKFKMDLEYVSRITFINDVKLVLKTIGVVFKRENIETGSFIEKDGVIYRPLDIERGDQNEN